MIKHIYIEDEIAGHSRVSEICARFPHATVTHCERYGQIFNTNAQNFRLQKQQPSLILAKKHNGHVLATPKGYGIGEDENYYFSHMLNCLYDCRYCFLQGMFRSAHYVVFVNYEDFLDQIAQKVTRNNEAPTWFFSGYDCDSLAMEPATGFIRYALTEFEKLPAAHLEIRTKSTQIRGLLERKPIANCVVAYSLTPASIASTLEHKAPSLEKRLIALRKLQNAGWNIGLRLDPLIYTDTFAVDFTRFLSDVFSTLDAQRIHSISYGTFRLPRDFFKKMVKLYPKERLFAGPLKETGGMVSYGNDREELLQAVVKDQLTRYVDSSILFPCS